MRTIANPGQLTTITPLLLLALAASSTWAEHPYTPPRDRVDLAEVIVVGTLGSPVADDDGWSEAALAVEKVLWSGVPVSETLTLRLADPSQSPCPATGEPSLYSGKRALWLLGSPQNGKFILRTEDEFQDLEGPNLRFYLERVVEPRLDRETDTPAHREKLKRVARFLAEVVDPTFKEVICTPGSETALSAEELLDRVRERLAADSRAQSTPSTP